ncbi:hypothetical protein CLOM621_08924 [Clostridium sp. M62/1]|nr:hypothetical protein CLOM621_08924 [Clostridium sp. M62/1]
MCRFNKRTRIYSAAGERTASLRHCPFFRSGNSGKISKKNPCINSMYLGRDMAAGRRGAG